jgi:hypothetical protein
MIRTGGRGENDVKSSGSPLQKSTNVRKLETGRIDVRDEGCAEDRGRELLEQEFWTCVLNAYLSWTRKISFDANDNDAMASLASRDPVSDPRKRGGSIHPPCGEDQQRFLGIRASAQVMAHRELEMNLEPQRHELNAD